MLTAVLFDMDGVLVDSEPEYKRIEASLALSVGVELTEEDVKSNRGKRQLDVWRGLKEKYGFSEQPSEMVEQEESMIRVYYEKDLKAIAPAVELLKSCHKSGLKIAIATSSLEDNAKLVVKNLGLEKYVDAIAGGDKVKNSKPAPDIFLLAAKMLDTPHGECVVIEDSVNGVIAAKAAGMMAVGVDAHDIAQDFSQADITVKSLEDINVETLRSLL